jgi:hypothetical protein
MAHPAGETETGDLRVDFDRRLRLEFHVSRITSDAGLLAFRELDDALGLTGMAAGDALADSRTGRNSRHSLMAQFRQSVFGRIAGYEDVNDADRLGADPAMRRNVGGQAVTGQAASTRQMGRFETEVLAKEANVTALAHLLKSPVGRPPSHVRRLYASFRYQAGSWSRKRRVVAKVEWHPGELYPRVVFIVTNLARGYP